MDGYNNTLDHSLYEAVSSAKSCVSSASSGLSTNSQTALLHKKSSHGKRSKRRPHSAILVSHLSHPDPSKLETLATFPPIEQPSPDSCPGTVSSDASKTSQTSSKNISSARKTEKTKCQLCAIYSLLIVFLIVLLALISSIVLLVQLPSDSTFLASITSSYNESSKSHNSNQISIAKLRNSDSGGNTLSLRSGLLKSESASELLKNFQYVASSMNYDNAPSDDIIYSRWSKWSRCRKKCRQVRRRRCINPTRCGRTILKETRPCNRRRSCKNQQRGGNRKNRQKGNKRKGKRNFLRSETGEWQHIVRKKKLSKKSKLRMRKNKAFYSNWSKWAKCSDKCTTARYKKCDFETLCGLEKVIEEAYCYIEGTKCQSWHRQGRLEQKAKEEEENGNSIENSIDGIYQNDNEKMSHQGKGPSNDQCGIHKKTYEDYRIGNSPWALKIIGGRQAIRGRWPWQVAILNKYREVFCGGTLVAPGWVLTAAHCVRKHLFVRLGEHDTVVREGSELEYAVKDIITHPNYNPENVDNDVALLKIPVSDGQKSQGILLNGHEIPKSSFLAAGLGLKSNDRRSRLLSNTRDDVKPKVFSSFPPACLPEQDEDLPVGSECMIIGWGKKKSTNIFGTDVLNEAEIPIVSRKECMNVYKDYYISDNMFCAGYQSGRRDTCAGDSGGPLLCKKEGRWTLYGITSFGEGCGEQGKYGIYAKVPNYTAWIRSYVNE